LGLVLVLVHFDLHRDIDAHKREMGILVFCNFGGFNYSQSVSNGHTLSFGGGLCN
jgi:hypothetical protein